MRNIAGVHGAGYALYFIVIPLAVLAGIAIAALGFVEIVDIHSLYGCCQ